MCRHLGYLGPPLPLAELLLDPPHSLLQQTWAPRDMRGGGTVNVDGFGAGWYEDGGEPARHRRAVPMWTDRSFAELARRQRSGAVLAAVRSATVGMPVSEAACAPFTDGRWLFSHNGVVAGWPESLAKAAADLDVVDLMTLEAPTDSAVLWALLRHRLHRGEDPARAVRAVVGQVVRTRPESRLNLLITDGSALVASTWGHALSVRRNADSVLLSSEPFGDDARWEPVPDRHLVVARPGSVHVAPLLDEGETP
ncbi:MULTISPECIES: ergothioneine biosynthesis protein EgtC [unclassified Saccharopolyspora]|uniref:ergothioneine biosynthesis protein EgtC n=1 Tax=unclassified Saccharopolyspora TaxID=2646250 RepID=UPI001CD80BAC|nr:MULTISPECIES: ergothioneine biosynthesis protein EgtC [unclassified Saccharopolyspora]MCA1185597.1 ergothioneine biosynthesis protein EgtC [Saccharopolyspora sp. 6T]MCA1280815.1 ergothioneine biosynthesis protein EgtC [Saccharopolyspora sp. 7B]